MCVKSPAFHQPNSPLASGVLTGLVLNVRVVFLRLLRAAIVLRRVSLIVPFAAAVAALGAHGTECGGMIARPVLIYTSCQTQK